MALSDAKSKVDEAFTRRGARGLVTENTFAGALSFMRRTYSKDLGGADLAITGVAFDQAVTNRPGARFGPRAIREASTLQPNDPPYGWDFDPLSEFSIIDYGDLAFDYAMVSEFPAALTDHISTILNTDTPAITLGGDHYITFPILRAFAAKYGPMAVVQFDAHSDLWPDDNMDRIDHGTMMYKAVKLGLVDPARSVQIGIRTTCDDYLGVNVIDAETMHLKGPDWTAARIREITGTGPTYVTFDIDALDPAYAPGTGTPVWGGLASWQAAAILQRMAGMNIVGGDVVEVCPPYDTTGATAIAGAHVAMELVCLALYPKRKQSQP